MKFKTTRKQIMDNYRIVIKVGYCDLQGLLKCEDPIAYTCSADGWNADVYSFGGTAIVTGYRPFGNVESDYDLNQRYERVAREVARDHSIPYNSVRSTLRNLIDQYIMETRGKEEEN